MPVISPARAHAFRGAHAFGSTYAFMGVCAFMGVLLASPVAIAAGNRIVLTPEAIPGNGSGANGKTVTVPVNETLLVKLPGTYGGGHWQLDTDLSPQITLSGRVTVSVKKAGAPQTTIYYFTPRMAGTVALKAHYIAAGDGAAAEAPFAVLLTVTAPANPLLERQD
jgi:hypothetical protein